MKLEAGIFSILALFAGMLITTKTLAETQINVVGLFSGKAVVMINGGSPKTMSVGQTAEGVKLLAANSQTATFQVEGKTKQLGMGQAAVIGGGGASSSPSVTIYANAQGHFLSECTINGAPLKFLVDTGATSVALNSGDAKFAKIDYKKGEPVKVGTANGEVTAYRVTIANLKIGAITLNQVEAVVMEGGSPSIVLMGMSVLNRLEMRRQDIALTLTKRY